MDIYRFSIVALKSSFYTFGGNKSDNKSTSLIAKFDTITEKWKKLGVLNQNRKSHSVFIHQGDFVVVGGLHYKAISNERCTMDGDKIMCTEFQPELEGYGYYPQMMSVSQSYCPK